MKIRNILFIVIFILGNIDMIAQTSCFEVRGNYSGYDFYPQMFKDSVCSLVQLVDELDKSDFDFKVISYDLPGLAEFMKAEDIEDIIQNKIMDINIEYPENISIFRVLSEDKIDYTVSLQLPQVPPFDTIEYLKKK